MKKNGFTLAEVLVTMAIIGVVAAITFPTINRIMPDKDKGMVLKAFKTLNEVNNDILTNPSLYMYGDGSTGCDGPFILKCTEKPLDENHSANEFKGASKYPYLFAESLALSENISVSNNAYNFTTIDGVQWRMTFTAKPNPALERYNITITTGNPSRDNTCTYNKTTCTNPGQFSFMVDMKGTVSAVDPLARAYLENPNDLSDRYADLRRAKELAN